MILVEKIKKESYLAYHKKLQKYLFFKGKKTKEELKEIFEDEFSNDNYKAYIPLRTVVINTTEKCNLRCLYCSRYQKDYQEEFSISEEILNKSIERAYQHAKSIDKEVVVQLHGGEPSLMLDRIEKILEDNKEKLSLLDLRIQTNAVDIDDDFISLCQDYDIRVGVSLDGPPSVTGNVRKLPNGESIFPKVEENIKTIKEEIPRSHISCLAVISSANVGKAEKVFEYIFNNQQIDDVSFLPLYPDFSACLNDPSQIIPKKEEMVEFSKNLFDLWIETLEEREICIPTFQIWFWNLAALNRGGILPNSSCGVGETMIFIDVDGNYYPCGPFSYEDSMIAGNVMEDSLESVQNNKIIKKFKDRDTCEINECGECIFQGICRGGCPANAFLQKDSVYKKDPFCDYWKGIISHIVQRIEENPEIVNLIPDYTIRL